MFCFLDYIISRICVAPTEAESASCTGGGARAGGGVTALKQPAQCLGSSSPFAKAAAGGGVAAATSRGTVPHQRFVVASGHGPPSYIFRGVLEELSSRIAPIYSALRAAARTRA